MKKFNFTKTHLALAMVSASSFLTGCAAIHTEVEKTVQKSGDDVKQIVRAAEPVSTAVPLVSKVKGSWVAERKPMIEGPKVEPLPAVFSTNFSNNTPGSIRVVDLMSRIQNEKGVQIRMAPEIIDNQVNDAAPGVGGSASSTNLPPLPGGLPSASGGNSNAGMNGVSPTSAQAALSGNRLSNLVYNGTLSGFLDLISSKMQLSWKYDGTQVVLYRYDTRVFNIKALAGTGKITNGVGGTSQSSGGSGQSTTGTTTQTANRTDLTITADLWKGVQDSIKVMLSPYGQKNFYASPDLGTITISDAPGYLDRVNTYVTTLNKDLSKQVAMHVAIYNVEIDDQDTVGVDWTAVWQTAGSNFGFNLGGLSSLGSAGSLQQAGVTILKGPWTNSQFVLGALNKVGKTSLVTRGQIMTMNRQAAPLQIVDENNYLAKVSTTMSSTGTAQTSLEPGTVTSGFTTTVTPKIEDDGDVLLQFAGSLSDLKSIDRFDVGSGANMQSIQLPQKSVRDFLQRVKLRSGETLVLTGFEQTKHLSNDQGVGNSKNLALGGKQFAQGKRLSIVITVTPYVVE
jgi:type IVB pilus formation R64 PilN family outer membrane protein